MNNRSSLPVGRLAAEFGVIVIGVLLALLAESAWQERGERAEEAEMLERISLELALDSANLGEDRIWFDQFVPIVEDARLVLAGGTTGSPAGDVATLLTASFRRLGNRDARTYDDLLASGRMSLIRNPAVRQALITFYGDLDEALEDREGLPTRYRERVTAQLPLAYVTRVLNQCIREDSDPDSPIPADVRERARQCGVEPEGGAAATLAEVRALSGLDEELGTLSYAAYNVSERVAAAERSFSELRGLLEREP